MPVTAERTRLYFCRPCTLHDRVTVRYSDSLPELPCPHAGSEPGQCRRVDWERPSYYCTICRLRHRTEIARADDPSELPEVECRYGHVGYWAPTQETQYVMQGLPSTGVGEGEGS